MGWRRVTGHGLDKLRTWDGGVGDMDWRYVVDTGWWNWGYVVGHELGICCRIWVGGVRDMQ